MYIINVMLYLFRPAYAEVSDIHAVSSAVENAASVRIGLDIDSDFAQFFEAESTEGDRVSGAVEGKQHYKNTSKQRVGIIKFRYTRYTGLGFRINLLIAEQKLPSVSILVNEDIFIGSFYAWIL